jgi:integrase
MASIYRRKDSKNLWVRFKKNGKWVGERTQWLIGDRADEKKARQFAAEKTLEEMAHGGRNPSGNFADWVDAWMIEQHGSKKTATYGIYTQQWGMISEWLNERGYYHPQDVTRESLSDYKEWRKPREGVRRKGAGMNTIIPEIRTLGRVLKEAKTRGYCREVVTEKLGWHAEDRREFEPWTNEEIERALAASDGLPPEKQWIRAALILGTYQASRSEQIGAKLSSFDFDQEMIFWPKEVMKGKKRDWVQPMDPRAAPLLKKLVEARRLAKKTTLADRPELYALYMRRWLDSEKIGIPKQLHGLRATWITKAALAGVPEAVAMAYVHHAGPEVHRIYQRIKPVQTAEFLKKISFGK